MAHAEFSQEALDMGIKSWGGQNVARLIDFGICPEMNAFGKNLRNYLITVVYLR
jgi:hypothetical protein